MFHESREGWAESDRLSTLKRYRIIDTPPEPEFDDLAQLAARACHTPIALISVIDDRRQWLKAEIGLGVREIPLDQSICAKAVCRPGLTAIRDLAADPRFEVSSLVTGKPQMRFYAGVLLETREALPLGTLCVLDHVSRDLDDEQAFTLKTLARQVMSHLELRRAIAERDEAIEGSRRVELRQTLLVRELHHRVRNSLALVQALVGATARQAGTAREFYRSFSARIASLAKTQGLLTDDYWQTAQLREMLLSELRPYADQGPVGTQTRFALSGPQVELSADLAVPVGMALHELTANAAKHGALSVPGGHVAVTWEVREVGGTRQLHLEWTERGGPAVREPRREGFGTALLQKVLPMQSSAQVDVEFDPAGIRFRMAAPMIEHRLVPAY